MLFAMYAFFIIILILFFPALVTLHILAPVSELALRQPKPARLRFALVDFFSLVFLTQLLFSGCTFLWQDAPIGFRIATALIAMIPVAIVWRRGVKTLTSLGIQSAWTRFLYIAYALPVAVAVPFWSLIFFITWVNRTEFTRGKMSSWLVVLECVAILAAVHVWFYIRRMTAKVTAASE